MVENFFPRVIKSRERFVLRHAQTSSDGTIDRNQT